tara:strand:+ start:1135 stop:1653 length:519 start_codon:yes stop_codon:yes gene_type:complete
MNNFEYSPIAKNFLEECYRINEDNVPEVGSRSLQGLSNSIQNSDYNECVVFKNKVVGFVICFQDNEKTISYMQEIQHKNFKEISKRVTNFLYIDRIAIDSKFRKNKLATELYSKIIDFGKKNSIENLTAEINLLPSVNIPSFNLHKNFGFIEIDTVKYAEDYEVSLQKKTVE